MVPLVLLQLPPTAHLGIEPHSYTLPWPLMIHGYLSA